MNKTYSDSDKNKSFYKTLFSMVIPLAFQNLMTAAVNASDAIMVGFLNQDSLSAVSLAGQINFIFTLFMAVMTISTTILAAQYWGKKEFDTVEKIMAYALKMSMTIGLIFFIGTFFFPSLLMSIFTSEKTLIDYGSSYLRITSFTFLLLSVSQIYLCIMKNSLKTFKSTMIASSAMILNVILNAIFIFGLLGLPEMGIEGAAIATVISRIVETTWAVLESHREGSIRLRFKYILKIDDYLRHDFVKNSIPVYANYLIWGVGFTMYSVIMGHLGSDAVAANSMANIMKNLVICVCGGIGTAGSILVGNELGKGDIDNAKICGGRVTKLAIISGVVSGGILLALTPVVLNIVQLSDISRGYLQGMLLMCGYYVIGKSVNSTTIGGIFCAGGDAKFGVKCDGVVMWCIMIPLGMLSAFVWKLPVLTVYFILSMDEMIKLPVVYLHYKKYGWAKNLTRDKASQE
jgi:putative MATE family efflux protein